MANPAVPSFQEKYRETARTYIVEVMQKLNCNQAQLAKKVNVAPSTFTRTIQEHSNSVIKPSTLYKVAEVTKIPLPRELLGWVQNDCDKPDNVVQGGDMPNKPPELFGSGKGVPLYSLLPTEQSDGLYTLLRRGTTDRPRILDGIEEARALIVPDDSMVPVFAINHIVETDPSRRPLPGDDVVVEIDSGEVMIRRFVHMDRDRITLAHYNPVYKLTAMERAKVRTLEKITFVIRQ